jgi:hypothetical protein
MGHGRTCVDVKCGFDLQHRIHIRAVVWLALGVARLAQYIDSLPDDAGLAKRRSR